MKLRKTKEDNLDIGAYKEGYLCNHEEFDRETTCYRFSTQPQHAANWFHTKGECATQTHMWKPGYQSLHLRTTSFLVSELVIVCSSCSFSSKVLVHLADPQNFRSDTRNDVALSCQRITSTLEQSDDRSNKRGGSSNRL
ncbi:hypothetical protein F2Q70_00019111 [Brassica cretica]|uniref:Uncharacterized protein n=1 Tax=Brassica cretica TaxID=69181 RepID=A0A8S9GJ77_BRACR|nr:hypothetical protein F2Q70_00019111 [Brassica cretica]